MWNKSKSLMLSIFCTRLFLVLLAIVVVFAPQVIRWFFGESEAMLSIHGYLRATIYTEAVPASAILLCLHRLLRNIRRNKVFEEENIRLLRVISWGSIAAGIVALVSAFYYSSFWIVAVACAFFGLILRVIKNVFEQALEIKNENDFTI